ncbi:hypothetical protein ACFYR1_00635 [Streptomyces canus]|uniref:hypothetical protein n=1 Tax=Streptomyces canus TaxID=58343 RepID=UPI003677AAC3
MIQRDHTGPGPELGRVLTRTSAYTSYQVTYELLTPGERRELLRHRCLLRVPRAVDALARTPGWERDLMPFDWRLP